MTKRDYYEILGIDKNADEAAVKRAYRNLAMKCHPDRNPSDSRAAEKMKELNEAYAVLSDAQKRRLYDTYGHAGLASYTQEDIFRGVDFSGLFREFGLGDFFGFGDGLFDSLFGRRSTSSRGPRKGADLRYDLDVTLEEVAVGAEKTVELPKAERCAACEGTGAAKDGLVQCQTCKGTGQIVKEQRSGHSVFRQITACNKCRGKGKIIKEACKECQGKGIIEVRKEFVIQIPAGANTGYKIRIEGEGEKEDGLPGDLYIVLNVEKHPLYERHGDDIYLQKEIPITTAALGSEIEVSSLNGNRKLDIPEGTQTGTVFRIIDGGIQHLDGPGKGDEYVIVKVVTPTKLNHKEKELLRQFEKLRQESEVGEDGQNGKG
jgi:molecular chaperone DnaJ